MTALKSKKKYVEIAVIISLVVLLLGSATACTYPDQWQPPAQPAPAGTTESAKETAVSRGTIKNEDAAILAVYRYLLDHAQSHRAKAYLADFYTKCDKWSAKSELLKDGTSVWYVEVDMTAVKDWKEKPHWQKASWMILKDGTVLPSNRFQANALRIEADLGELNLVAPAEKPK